MKIAWGLVSTADIADAAVAPAIRRSGDEISSVVSRDAGRAEAFAARHGIGHATTSYDELLARPDVDAVYIAGPNAQHAEQVLAAAAAGKHVLCEKPLATTPEDARRAVDACRDADVRLGVNFQGRHNDAVLAARDTVARGEIGDVVLVECEVAYPGGAPSGWRADRDLAGLGTIHNLGVHAFDLIRFVCGAEFAQVTAMLDQEPPESVALVLARLDSGALVRVTAIEVASRQRATLAIQGTGGHIAGANLTPPSSDPARLAVLAGDAPETTVEAPTTDTFDRAIAEFGRAVAEGREPNASGLDGLRSAELAMALADSARAGASVSLPR